MSSFTAVQHQGAGDRLAAPCLLFEQQQLLCSVPAAQLFIPSIISQSILVQTPNTQIILCLHPPSPLSLDSIKSIIFQQQMFPFSTEHPEYLNQAVNKGLAHFIHSFLQAESRAKHKHKARRTTAPTDQHSF